MNSTCQGPAVRHHGDLEEAHILCVGPDELAYTAAASVSPGSPRSGFFLLVIVCRGGWVGALPGFRLTKSFLLEHWQWLGRGREMAWHGDCLLELLSERDTPALCSGFMGQSKLPGCT